MIRTFVRFLRYRIHWQQGAHSVVLDLCTPLRHYLQIILRNRGRCCCFASRLVGEPNVKWNSTHTTTRTIIRICCTACNGAIKPITWTGRNVRITASVSMLYSKRKWVRSQFCWSFSGVVPDSQDQTRHTVTTAASHLLASSVMILIW